MNLTENGAISEEEAEARKRAAKQRTEEKNQELEKRNRNLRRNRLYGIRLQVWHRPVLLLHLL